MIKCILGTKLGDLYIQSSNGSLFPIHPSIYESGLNGYWQLKKIDSRYEILKFLRFTL